MGNFIVSHEYLASCDNYSYVSYRKCLGIKSFFKTKYDKHGAFSVLATYFSHSFRLCDDCYKYSIIDKNNIYLKDLTWEHYPNGKTFIKKLF